MLPRGAGGWLVFNEEALRPDRNTARPCLGAIVGHSAALWCAVDEHKRRPILERGCRRRREFDPHQGRGKEREPGMPNSHGRHRGRACNSDSRCRRCNKEQTQHACCHHCRPAKTAASPVAASQCATHGASTGGDTLPAGQRKCQQRDSTKVKKLYRYEVSSLAS